MRFYLVYLLLSGVLLCNGQSVKPLDYSDDYHWAARPDDGQKVWESFVIEEPFQNVDVFYIYPTILTDTNDFRWNYDVTDPRHRDDVINYALKYQASAWAGTGNIYAPFYRQAHIRSFANKEVGGEAALQMAYRDVKAAFDYYMAHYNQGHAIILSGHSQGTVHVAQLMQDYFDEKPLQAKLIAAYIPGIGIKKDAFKSIPLMLNPEETGGFVTWNTLKEDYQTARYFEWYKCAEVINPVTWTESSVAPKKAHKGFLYTNNHLYKKSFETHLVDGAIYLSLIKFPFSLVARKMEHFHRGDVNLFWKDISVNARLRTTHYLGQQ